MEVLFPKPLRKGKKAPKNLIRTELQKESANAKSQRAKYNDLREQFLLANKLCQARFACDGTNPSSEPHHRRGRGKWLLAVSTWLAVCSECHKAIHSNVEESYKRGLMLKRNNID